jgi:hypothetical protein
MTTLANALRDVEQSATLPGVGTQSILQASVPMMDTMQSTSQSVEAGLMCATSRTNLLRKVEMFLL